MSTYIPGATDMIPQVQPFSPDYNFYSGALGLKQGKQDAAKKQLNSLYGSLLNAPLTRGENIEARDQFFKTIDQDIKKMAGMDLSLASNADAAKDIFNQLTDNNNIVKDMVWTKSFHDQMKKSQGFKNCKDSDDCGGSWWQGGDDYLNYQRQDFANASADEAMGMQNAKYVPHQDLTKQAMALAEEADLNVSIDQVTGQWITTTKNGALIEGGLQKLFKGSLGGDPKMTDYFTTKALLQRRNWTSSNTDVYGSEENAEQEYINQYMPIAEKTLSAQEGRMTDDLKVQQAQGKVLDEGIAKAQGDKRSKLEQIRTGQYQIEDHIQSSLANVKDLNGEIGVAKRKRKFDARTVDKILGSMALDQEIGEAAQLMALKDAEYTMKANPYALKAVEHQYKLQLENVKFQNKLKVKSISDEAEAQGGAPMNLPETSEVLGAIDTSNDEKTRGHQAVNKMYTAQRLDASGAEKNIYNEVYTASKSVAEAGSVQGKKDVVALTLALAESVKVNPGVISMKGRAEFGEDYDPERDDVSLINGANANTADRLVKQLNAANSLDERYAIAKEFSLGLEDVSGSQIDKIYDSALSPMLDSKDQGNSVFRGHLNQIKQNSGYANSRSAIQAKRESLKRTTDMYSSQVKQVLADVKSTNAYDEEMLHAFESLHTGGKVNLEPVFIKKMMDKGHSYDTAERLYKGTSEGISGWDAGRKGWNYVTGDDEEYAELERQQALEGPGVFDAWREAHSKHVDRKGASSMAGLLGAGDEAARGQTYRNVDPKAFKSDAYMGMMGVFKDGFREDATFAFGNFETELPENNKKARAIIETLYTDIHRDAKSASRPMPTITYTNIAASDGNKVGMRVQFDQGYLKKYVGSESKPGFMSELEWTQGLEQGVTIYLDKNKTTNLFTEGAKKSADEQLLEWNGSLDLDSDGEFTKDYKLAKVNGVFVASGAYNYGVDENGEDMWGYGSNEYTGNTSVDEIARIQREKLNHFSASRRSQEVQK